EFSYSVSSSVILSVMQNPAAWDPQTTGSRTVNQVVRILGVRILRDGSKPHAPGSTDKRSYSHYAGLNCRLHLKSERDVALSKAVLSADEITCHRPAGQRCPPDKAFDAFVDGSCYSVFLHNLPHPRRAPYHPAKSETTSLRMSETEISPNLRIKGRLMSASEIERTLVRLAHEIVEKSNGSEDLVLVGIKRRGIPLAERLGKLIATIEKRPTATGSLDIQFYRDDLSTADVRPLVTVGSIGCEVEGRDVLLCDDVLYTGRTIRAALDALFDHGRPRRVQLCVLIDRGHRELPIEATYIGKHVPTSSREI